MKISGSALLLVLAVVAALLVGSTQAFVPRLPASTVKSAAPAPRTQLRAEGPNLLEWGSRFLNELLPWGDTSKGLWAGKRDAMVVKYMERTGCSKEVAEKEVDEYLADKEGYIIRKRAEEDRAKKGRN